MNPYRCSTGNTKKVFSKSRCRSTTINQSPLTISLNESRITYQGKSLFKNPSLKETLRSKLMEIMADTSKTIPVKSEEPIFRVQDKEKEQILIAQQIEQMKQDRLLHLLYKNRIKNRFFKANRFKEQPRSLNHSPERLYSTTQHETLHKKPKYNYLELESTFYSRSKRRVFSESFGDLKVKDSRCRVSIAERIQKEGTSYLKYSGDRKQRIKFQESRRCKTEGVSHLSENKNQILRMYKQGSEFQETLNVYLEAAIHSH